MSRPGEYVADPTEGIIHPNDLPPPKTQHRSRIRDKCRCPHCKYLARQNGLRERSLHHLGDPLSGRPVDIILRYSLHYGCQCKFHVSNDEVYDGRCCRVTAWKRLETLRERVKRFKRLSQALKKIESPTLDRSLMFLDDKKLPSASNAVERGNRRFRKMQKTVYKVRTLNPIRERIALDMCRDSHWMTQCQTIQTLHQARAG